MLLPKKGSESITLYFSYVPVLLLLVLVLSVTSIAGIKSLSTKNTDGSVLSKGSDSEDEDDKDKEENEDEKESEDNDNDENEDRDEPNDSKTRKLIVNPNGTTSQVRREVEDGGKVKTEIRTFDSNGNKIKVEKYESEDGKEKSRVTTYDISGTKLSDLKLETEDGRKLELRVKEGQTDFTRIRYDNDKNELIVKTNESSSESELKVKLEGNDFKVSRKGVGALSKFPISIDDATGKIFVTTPNGEVELKSMPDTIVQKAKDSDELDEIDSLELSKQTNTNQNDLEYTVSGTRTEKLLGLFSLQIPTNLIYDATTGNFVKDEQALVNRILSLFSF